MHLQGSSVLCLAGVLLVAVLLIDPSGGLQCYSCATDIDDLDCDNVTTLAEVYCTPFSADHPVQPVCGYQRLVASASDGTDRIWRGCSVGGQCALLSSQGDEAYNSAFSMTACEECSTDSCNGPSDSGAVTSSGNAIWWSVMMLLVCKIVLT